MSVERWANCHKKEFAHRSKRSLNLKERACLAMRSVSDVTMLGFLWAVYSKKISQQDMSTLHKPVLQPELPLDRSVLQQPMLPQYITVLQQPVLPWTSLFYRAYAASGCIWTFYISLRCLWTGLSYSTFLFFCSTAYCAASERVCRAASRGVFALGHAAFAVLGLVCSIAACAAPGHICSAAASAAPRRASSTVVYAVPGHSTGTKFLITRFLSTKFLIIKNNVFFILSGSHIMFSLFCQENCCI